MSHARSATATISDGTLRALIEGGLMEAVRTALYVDFDNFFSGLLEADPQAALTVVERPSTWLSRLTNAHSDNVSRRWLVLRSYMNPGGWVDDPRAPGSRLYFSRLRPFFTRAGFEVIDCPSLTRGAKNGADIRIAIDVMTALRAPVHYDEFVIASSDADFTPLLQVVRADDRRITVVATGSTSAAFEALADRYLDEQDVVDLMTDPGESSDGSAPEAGPAEPQTAPSEVGSEDEEAFRSWIIDAYARAEGPLNLAQLAARAVEQVGPMAKASRWFGAGTFSKAIARVDLPDARFSQHHLWDARRHAEPDPPGRESPHCRLPEAVSAFAVLTGLPRIESDLWPPVYSLLADYLARGSFSLAEATSWPRDRAADQGLQIPRSAFVFVIRACRGIDVDTQPEKATKLLPERIAHLTMNGVLRQARLSGMEPSDAEVEALQGWLHVPNWSAAEKDPSPGVPEGVSR